MKYHDAYNNSQMVQQKTVYAERREKRKGKRKGKVLIVGMISASAVSGTLNNCRGLRI